MKVLFFWVSLLSFQVAQANCDMSPVRKSALMMSEIVHFEAARLEKAGNDKFELRKLTQLRPYKLSNFSMEVVDEANGNDCKVFLYHVRVNSSCSAKVISAPVGLPCPEFK